MEFPFNVNDVILQEITIVQRKDLLQSSSKFHNDITRYAQNKQNDSQRFNLSKIIDAMGNSSSQAQGLKGAITTSFKLKSSDDHLYILKEPHANNGLGAVVGIIRVGVKRLFLTDVYGQQHECNPLCVLDFYVHESKQRSGCGKILFQHMITAEDVGAHELAIDRPSPKFVNFLSKHYNLNQPLQQVNKFVVFPPFFNDFEAIGVVDTKRRKSAPTQRKSMKDRLIRPESRNANSATVGKDRNLAFSFNHHKYITNALNNLSDIPLLSQAKTTTSSSSPNPFMRNGQQDTRSGNEMLLLGDKQQNDRATGSGYAQRKQAVALGRQTNRLGNYSRHAIRQESIGSSTVTRVQPPPKVSLDTRNHLTSQNYTVTHSRAPNVARNITSLDNPFANTTSSDIVNDTSVNDTSVNYTVGLLEQLNINKSTFGTSWNVFGVPTTLHHNASNPYANFRRRENFPS